jgi:membrane protease YdiL (CAAX protease family)
MVAGHEPQPTQRLPRPAIEALLAYVALCGVSLFSRLFPCVFGLVVFAGIGFPLYWGRRTGDWATLGFRRSGLGRALLWGTGTGMVSVLYVVASARLNPLPPPPLLPVQLALAIPIAFLVLAPFQEFFFRGWLQPRLQHGLGKAAGLVVTSLGFSFWHLLPPFEGTPTSAVSVSSPSGLLTTLGMGLVFGYAFQRTSSIVAPWLAHALMIVALVGVGGMTFVQYSP